MEVALRCCPISEVHSSAVLSATFGITLQGVSNTCRLWDLSGQRRADGVKVVLWRTPMLEACICQSHCTMIRSSSVESAYHRHLTTLAGHVHMVPETLIHDGSKAPASPEKDTELTILTWGTKSNISDDDDCALTKNPSDV